MTQQGAPNEAPLESWKAIAAHLNRDVRTVMRWEQGEGLPVHRHRHLARSSVYAFPSELDRWRAQREIEPRAGKRVASRYGPLILTCASLVAMASAGGGRVNTAPQSRVTFADGLTRLVCENCGDAQASVSPDGRYLATQVAVPDAIYEAFDISVRDLAAGTLAPLGIITAATEAPASAGWPIFSPDGTQIAYSLLKGRHGTELHVRPRRPGPQSRMLRSFPPFNVVHPLAWSAGGALLVRLHMPADNVLATVSASDGKLTILKSLGKRVLDGSSPRMSLSPDGRYLAYATRAADSPDLQLSTSVDDSIDWQVYLLAVADGHEVRLTTGVGSKRSPMWSSDGSRLMYLSDVTGTWDLWAIPMRGDQTAGSATLVRSNIGRVTPLGVSATGAYHYFEDQRGAHRTSIVMLSAPRTGNVVGSLIGQRPAWSPDGRFIVVSRLRPDLSDRRDIVVRDVTTAEEQLYRRPGVGGPSARWFPDGRGLLVIASDPTDADPDRRSWFRIDRQSGEARRYAPYRTDQRAWALAGTRALSPDGRMLYLGGYTYPSMDLDRIFALDPSTGSHRLVHQLSAADVGTPAAGAGQMALAVSPDGNTLAIAFVDFNTNRVRVATVATNGRGYRELAQIARPASLSNQFVWTQDGRWIVVSTRATGDADVHRLVRIRPEGGPPEDMGLEIGGLNAFDVSPDGTRLAFSTTRAEGGARMIWLLDVGSAVSAAK